MTSARARRDYDESTRGLVTGGATFFAASMLTLTGVWQILVGITAVADDELYVDGIAYSYELDLTTWGWVLILVGAVALAVGAGIFARVQWAVVAGIAIGLLSAISNFAFLPYYPLWTLVIIAFDAFVIWALCDRLAHME